MKQLKTERAERTINFSREKILHTLFQFNNLNKGLFFGF